MKRIANIKIDIGKKIKAFSDRKFEHFYNEGIDCYERQNYEKAIENFKLAIQQEKVQSRVYYNLALTYQCSGDYDRAIATYYKFLELNPKDYDGLYNIAVTYYMIENFTKAAEFFEQCVEIKKDAEAVKALVLTYLDQNELQKAINFAEELFEIPQGGVDLYYMIAKIFENKNQLGKGFIYINKAMEMYFKTIEKSLSQSTNFNAYLAISICYAKKGDLESSFTFCEKALKINSESYDANYQMGLIYDCCDKTEDAIKHYETALSLSTQDDYKIYSSLGYAYEKTGQYDSAVNIFSQLISKCPECPSVEEIKKHLNFLQNNEVSKTLLQ